MTEHAKVFIKKAPQGASRYGHPWVYRSQIREVTGSPKPGEVVDILSEGKRFLGRGYFNPQSEISVRFLTRDAASIDKNFFVSKIKKALDFRKAVLSDTNAYRLISSEGDDLPGLVIDQYGEVQVVQFLTLGMERLKPLVLDALRECVPSKGIYEKSDSGSRRFEGLEESVGWIERSCGEETTVYERNIRYGVRFAGGHKTGLYLDQRENRLLLADLKIKGSVLDAFCYEGGFGLHLALSGAQVLGLDIQEEVIARAEENRKLNQISAQALQFKVTNVFDELKALEKEKRKFDLVILDPPSFVKRKDALEGALAGYKEILLRSMKILNEGGLLAVFSCSYHVDDNLLMQASLSAACDVRKSLRVLKFLKQAADHPINPFIPETYYLKGFLFAVGSL